jgi:hypothetical protein
MRYPMCLNDNAEPRQALQQVCLVVVLVMVVQALQVGSSSSGSCRAMLANGQQRAQGRYHPGRPRSFATHHALRKIQANQALLGSTSGRTIQVIVQRCSSLRSRHTIAPG